MNFHKKANLLVLASTILVNSLTIAATPANSQTTKRTLQTLPNGIHFYSRVRSPKQPGSEYIILRKRGNSFIYYGYVYQSDGGCGAGTIRGNTLKTTREYIPLDSEEIVESNSSINLTQYYKLDPRYISREDEQGLQNCIKRMSR